MRVVEQYKASSIRSRFHSRAKGLRAYIRVIKHILSSKGKGKDRNNSRIVVFGSVKASNGLPVLTILDMRPIENNLMIDDMQKVTSAYTKTKSPADFVKTSDVLYLDKKRTVKLLRSIGLQYRPTDLLLNGYIGSIDYSGTDVNISGVTFSSVVKETEEQNQQRTSTLTDREALQYAASEIHMEDLTDGEKDALRIFNERLSKLEALQKSRAEYGRIYKEQQFGTNVDRNAASATLNRMHALDEQIKRASDAVLSVEDKTVLKRVLHTAKGLRTVAGYFRRYLALLQSRQRAPLAGCGI